MTGGRVSTYSYAVCGTQVYLPCLTVLEVGIFHMKGLFHVAQE